MSSTASANSFSSPTTLSVEQQRSLLKEVDEFRNKGQADVIKRSVIYSLIAGSISAAVGFTIKRRFYPAAKPQPFVFFGVMPPVTAFVISSDKLSIQVDEELQRKYFNNHPAADFLNKSGIADQYQSKPSIFSSNGLYDFLMKNRVSIVAGTWLATVAGVFIYQYRTPGLTRLQRGYNMRLFSQTAAFGAVCCAMGLTAISSTEENDKYRQHNENKEYLNSIVSQPAHK